MAEIVIIKLGADGDVLRTIPLAKAIKDRHPDKKILWITKGDISSLLKGQKYIDEISVIPFKNDREFDVLYNFDIDDEAMALAANIEAEKKYGFYKEGNYPAAFNLGAEYYLNTMFDDELKKKNKKTYQEMMFEAAEIPYEKEGYELVLDKTALDYANKFVMENKIDMKNLIGIHIGASSRWPSKVWARENLRDFIIKAKSEGYQIILFGGPNEVKEHENLARELADKNIKVYRNNPSNSKAEFASLVKVCSKMVCSDSFSLHVSLGLKKQTVGLFFCTSPDEVEDYGLLTKISSPLLHQFFPERMNEFSAELVKSISSDEVLKAIKTNKKPS